MYFNLPLSGNKDLLIDTTNEQPLQITSWPGATIKLTKEETEALLHLLLEKGTQILKDIQNT